MKRLLFLTMVTGLLAAGSQAVVLTQWDMNATFATVPTASLGSGSASLVGGVAGSQVLGTVSGSSSSDPLGSDPANKAWNTVTYPTQGTLSGTAGVQFMASTVGHTSVQVHWDQRNSATASSWTQLQYSLNSGSSWTDFANYQLTEITFAPRSADLSSIAGAGNNPGFGIRMVSIFAPSTSAYAGTTSTYGTGGTSRFDMVTISAAPVPEPFTMALAAAGLGLAARRRMRRALGAP